MHFIFLPSTFLKALALSVLFIPFSFSNDIHPVIVPQSSLLNSGVSLMEEDEVFSIDRLIKSTKEQLVLQERLKEQMVQFKQQKDLFMQGEQTKRHAGVMVRTAREILEVITEQHLQYLFSTEYIEELTLFSSIAGKNGIKRP